jgi:dolichol-phosphate mannosyltransferase
MTEPRKLLSICVPVYDEVDNIFPFYERVRRVLDGLADRYDYEFVFTDNHSADGTFVRLAELAERDPKVRVIRFSRNFGFQRSILTNYMNALGDAAIQLDVDLQDPPELIPDFIRNWEEGYRVVYGVRRLRPDESPLLHGARRFFYRLIDWLSEDELPHDAGDFRLVDRRILDELKTITDQQPYLRGMIAAMGFSQKGIVYDRASRSHGQSKFKFRALVGLALDGILHHSILPLRLATYFGLAITALSAVVAVVYIIRWAFFVDDWPPGFATMSLLLLFLIGMNALILGIMGEYVGRIYRNVKRMPLTIVEARIDRNEPATGR